ncbi:acyltransferase family protein [Paucilactobacillus suebicus]|uniref:Acyltransferase n=1 Tax=Paucilactobacillus suebicus DSM 5007 = KCTC 3549 TaxID=1423807 RepID=A0A0R1VVL7_9LACO|nr:acyltransferase family protein [Paucilactobacillus suebicus]KRM09793.1 acyltransferase [Paucilactobacillus suebicus DSM 5007 = KCTC 3549]
MRIKWFSFVRIAGLTSVLTYHFFKNAYPGGFIGVDIFFTFSGFLITALMIDEFAKNGSFKLLSFYRRRFYRIVPPLILSVLIVVPLTYLVSPDYIVGLGKQIAAAIGFTTNYFEIATGGSYESKFIPHLFVHTWSLAVEMHFYITWGLIIAIFTFLIRHFEHNRLKGQRVFRWIIGITSLCFAGASSYLMMIQSAGLTDYSKVYFSTLTHCFPFFIGATLASLTGIKDVTNVFNKMLQHANKWVYTFAIVLTFSFLFLLGLKLQFSSRSTYTGGILVASILSALSILFARCLHAATPNVAEPKLATFIADISYSMYLYHWPLFVIFSKLTSVPIAVLLTLLVGVPCSALSYYVIEPYVAGKKLKWHVNTKVAKTLKISFASALTCLVAVSLYTVNGAPSLTSLDRSLWIGGINQSVDQMQTTKNIVLASTTGNSNKEKNIPKGVSIIGDSVTLGTRSYLGQHVTDSSIDAKGERTMNLAYQVLMTEQKNGILRRNVVICIGTNALDGTNEELMKIIHDIQPGHHLILMTPYDQRAAPDWNSSKLAIFERELPHKYNYITIADWQKVAAAHPDVFAGTDGVHFGGRHSGDVIYAQTINQGLKNAAKTPLK